jgi:broad specificity phosphatase PhoE
MLRTFLLALAFTLMPACAYADNLIYLVRHGEKAADGGKDPALTPQGQARARNIAAQLAGAGIRRIYSTDTQRTQQTAQPLAALLNLPVQSYHPGKQAEFAQQLKTLQGNTLVVGHSNTLTALVRELGGEPGIDIGDDEYGRIYRLSYGADGRVTTTMLASTAQ